jgi:acetylglutamate kinase
VGTPLTGHSPIVIEALCRAGYVPVIACIGADKGGQLFNVNADTLAGSLAARLRAKRLVIAGATRGVLSKGGTVAKLDLDGIEKLIESGTATAGMVAKLRACRKAVKGAVRDVVIADGREPRRLSALLSGSAPHKGAWTRITK